MAAKLTLKVAVAVKGQTVPRWQAALIRECAALSGVELSIIQFQRHPPARGAATWALKLLVEWDFRVTRRFTRIDDPATASAISLPAEANGFPASHFDIVIDLAGNTAAALALAPRDGAWRLAFGDDLLAHDDCPGTAETLASDEVTAIRLIKQAGTEDPPVILSEAFTAVDRSSIFVTKAQALWAAPTLVISNLNQRLAGLAVPPRAVMLPGEAMTPMNAGQAIRAAFKLIGRGLALAVCNAWARDEWRVHYRIGPATPEPGLKPDVAGFQAVPRVKNGFLADPCAVDWRGRSGIFCEQYLAGEKRGIISFVELKSGRVQEPPVTVLDQPYHLSYPHVFCDGNELFMIPESSANKTVELYRCLKFPAVWTSEAVLLSGLSAVDATMARIDGRFWMFTAVRRPGTKHFHELHLYSANHVKGPWRPHPRNPVRFDARDCRPAGALFQTGQGWIRPAQDGTVRYGRRIKFQRILELTETEYREETLGEWEPEDVSTAVGLHTFNRWGGVEVFDTVHRQPWLEFNGPRARRLASKTGE